MKSNNFSLMVLLIISSMPAFSQKDTVDVFYTREEIQNKNLKLFESDDILQLTLRFDITTFKRQRADTAELDAILTIHISETDSIDKSIKVRARGIMRRSYCDMPPIRLNFKKSDSPDDEFRDIDKIKLVTHCKLGNEDYTLREFIAYKLYNELTEYSYRVRLARITYINTNTKKESKPINEFAFLIEPDDALCERLKAVEVESAKVNQKMVRPEVMDRMAIFNYMIGNVDWSLPARHNVVFFAQPASSQPNLGIVIAYDFDYSGMVNTDYAVPTEGLGIETVRERRYLGVCRTREAFVNSLKEFPEKKDAFLKIINEFPYLKEKSKKDVINFLNGFFLSVERGSAVNSLLNGCIQF